MANNTHTHFTDYHNDFFSYSPSKTDEFVLQNIKPAYSLFIESLNAGPITMEAYLNGGAFKQNYEIAKKDVEIYVKDVLKKSQMTTFSKMPLDVIIATYRKNNYVIKGEFVLRVINDFILGKIKIGGYTHEKFIGFISDNTEYWRDSLIEMNKTTILLDDKKTLQDYLFLLDRYETYDESFIEQVKTIVDVFLF